MLLKADGLAAHLQARQKSGALAPIYVVAGDERCWRSRPPTRSAPPPAPWATASARCCTADARFRLSRLEQATTAEGTNCENLPETHAFLKEIKTPS